MAELENGDVIHSNRSVTRTQPGDGNSYFNNSFLKQGEVVDILYPDNDQNTSSGQFTQYNVSINNINNGAGNAEKLYSCTLINDLCGLADKSSFTLRKASKQPSETETGFSDGSKVLILCVNGWSTQAIIIGGVRDPKDETSSKDTEKDPGHNAYWIFNGINVNVDKNGAFSLEFKGPTKNDGKLDTDKVKDSAVGTTFSIDKDGNAQLSDKDQKNQLLIDHKNSKVLNTADKEYKVKVSDGKMLVDASGLEFGQASEKVIKGTTYRDAESQLHQKMSGSFQSMSQLSLTTGTQLTAAATLAVGPLAALKPGLQAAGAAMIAMQTIITNLKSALDTFEAQKEQYLSKKVIIE